MRLIKGKAGNRIIAMTVKKTANDSYAGSAGD